MCEPSFGEESQGAQADVQSETATPIDWPDARRRASIRGEIADEASDAAALWTFNVSAARAEQAVAIVLEGPPRGSSAAILTDHNGEEILSVSGRGRAVFPALVLPEGTYGLRVSLSAPGAYRLKLRRARRPAPGSEIEPNHHTGVATALLLSETPSGAPFGRIEGVLSSRNDVDVIAFDIDELDHLWRVQLNGPGQLALRDAQDRLMTTLARPAGARSIRSDGLDLLPGRYTATLTRGDGDYTLLVQSLGVVPPDFEREPNDTDAAAIRLSPGQSRRGLLPPGDDQDRYVFHAPGRDNYRLTVVAPDDARITADLHHDSTRIGRVNVAPGKTGAFAAELEAGRYTVALNAGRDPGMGLYQIALELDDPQDPLDSDIEPNNSPQNAQPAPIGGRFHGVSGGIGGWDYYRVPLPPDPAWFVLNCPLETNGEYEAAVIRPDGSAASHTDYRSARGVAAWPIDPADGDAWLLAFRIAASTGRYEEPYDCRLYAQTPESLTLESEPEPSPLLAFERAPLTGWRLEITGGARRTETEGDVYPFTVPDGADGARWRCGYTSDQNHRYSVDAALHDGHRPVDRGRLRHNWRDATFGERTPKYLFIGGAYFEEDPYKCEILFTQNGDASFAQNQPPTLYNEPSPDETSPIYAGPEPITQTTRVMGRIGWKRRKAQLRLQFPPGELYGYRCAVTDGPDGATLKIDSDHYGHILTNSLAELGDAVVRPMRDTGENTLSLSARSSDWTRPVDFICDIFGPDVFTPYPTAESIPWSISADMSASSIAAYHPLAQRVSGSLTLANDGSEEQTFALTPRATGRAWRVEGLPRSVSVGGGGSETLAFDIIAAPFTSPNSIGRAVIAATSSAGQTRVAAAPALQAASDADPTAPEAFSATPPALQGGLNLLDRRLGARLISVNDEAIDPDDSDMWRHALHDGQAPLVSAAHAPQGDLVFRLAGDQIAPLRGVVVSQRLLEDRGAWARDLRVETSTDGASWSHAGRMRLEAVHERQHLVFDSPIQAQYVRIVAEQAVSRDAPGLLGEVMAIAEPGFIPSTFAPLNAADTILGGHVVAFDVNHPANHPPLSILDPTKPMTVSPKEPPEDEDAPPPPPNHWVIGFARDRAALVTGFEWVQGDDGAPPAPYLDVSVSVDGVAQFTPLTRLAPTAGRMTLDRPVWARFVRFDVLDSPDGAAAALPRAVSIFEAAPSDAYLPVAGLWDEDSPRGPYERFAAPPRALPAKQGGDRAETAVDLAFSDDSADIASRVRFVEEEQTGEDWFTFIWPEDAPESAMLAIDGGDDGLREAAAILFNSEGAVVPMALTEAPRTPPPGAVFANERADRRIWRADLTPGASYRLQISIPGRLADVRMEMVRAVRDRGPAIARAFRHWADVLSGPRDAVRLPWSSPWADKAGFSRGRDAILRGLNAPAASGGGTSSMSRALEEVADALTAEDGAKISLAFLTGAVFNNDADYDYDRVLADTPVAVTSLLPPCNDVLCPKPRFGARRARALAAASRGRFQRVTYADDIEEALAAALTALSDWRGYRLSIAAVAPEAKEPELEPEPEPEIAVLEPEPEPQPEAVSPAPPQGPRPPRLTGRLTVQMAEGDSTLRLDASQDGAPAVALVLDASGSMLQYMPAPDNRRRIAVARAAVTQLIREVLPAGTPFAFRAFGLRIDACDSEIQIPYGPLDPVAAERAVRAVPAINLARTPIAASLTLAAEDLAAHIGPRSIILLTDGQETCDGDPAAAIDALRAQGIDVRVDIIGFAIDDAVLKADFESWARRGGGSYFDATDAASLETALVRAAAPGYVAAKIDGAFMKRGVLGESLRLPPGVYRLTFDDPRLSDQVVHIKGGSERIVISDFGAAEP